MNNPWKDEFVAEAISLQQAGLSASKIASELNSKFSISFSRNAIIGKLHRLGYSIEGGKSKSRAKKIVERRAQSITQPLPTGAPAKITEELDSKYHCSLQALPDDGCLWPIEDGLCCGAPKQFKRKPYCSIHSGIARRHLT